MAAVLAPPIPGAPDLASLHHGAGLVPNDSAFMDRTESSGSGNSRGSSADTVKSGPSGVEDDQHGAAVERAKALADSLSKLEGRTDVDDYSVQQKRAPETPEKADNSSFKTASADRPSAEYSRLDQERNRLSSGSPRPRRRGTRSHASNSSRASIATLDSVLTTGESVYEDAKETPDEDGWEDEVLPYLPLSELSQPPILLNSISSGKHGEIAATPRTRLQESPFDQHAFSPRSAFEEQAILLQRRASLQAQEDAHRRPSARMSLSPRTKDRQSTTISLRRYSATASSTVPIATRRMSAAANALTSPPRQQRQLKPLVLTPSRTVQAPLTSATPTSPARRRGSSAFFERDGVVHSRNGSIASAAGFGLAMADCRSPSPRSPPSATSPRRRSMNYIDTSKSMHALATQRDSLSAPVSRRVQVESPRTRTGSTDTGSTRLTGDSLSSRASSGAHVESPASSVEGWPDEKDAQAGTAGPLEMVDEAEGADDSAAEQKSPLVGASPITSPHLSSASPPKPLPHPPIVRHKVKYDENWNGETVAEDSDATALSRPSHESLSRPSHESLSRPSHESLSTPLPCSPPNSSSSTSSPLETRSSTAEPGEGVRSLSPKKGKPIVIKSVTERSSAANARRSQRLSRIEPPVVEGGHRFSRAMRRLSGVPAPAPVASPHAQASPLQEQPSARSPTAEQRSPKEQHCSPRFEQQSQQQRRMSSPRVQAPPGHAYSGLAIWPPPAETKTMSLAPPLAYSSDGESAAGFSSCESGSDSEGFDAQYGARPTRSSRLSARRTSFQPRNPRAAPEDADFGPESWLEVLLNEEPPPRSRRFRAGEEYGQSWSSHMGATADAYKKGSVRSFGSTHSGSMLTPPKASGLTQRIFGGLRAKSPAIGYDRPKKPISIAPQHTKRRKSTKPRPIVSGPLELQAASSAMAQQRSHSSASSYGSVSSYDFAPSRSTSAQKTARLGHPMVHYPSVAAAATARVVQQSHASEDVREELASLHFESTDDLRASLDPVLRPPPQQIAVPPGLLTHGVAPSSASASPAESHSSGGLGSPPCARSRQGSHDNSAGGSRAFPSPSHAARMHRQASLSSPEQAVPMRETWRTQALVR